MDTLLVNGEEYFEARRIIDHLESVGSVLNSRNESFTVIFQNAHNMGIMNFVKLLGGYILYYKMSFY